ATPYLRDFFRTLGIAESAWMPACNATYKAGIFFPGWSGKPGFESYFHPFFSQLDRQTALPFFDNCVLARFGLAADCHPDDFFVSAELARQGKAPVPERQLPFAPDYAYHFDATLLSRYLRDHAKGLGVRHLADRVLEVKHAENGAIAGLITAVQGEIEGDFFLDCTGFASVLIGKALGEPFHSYAGCLLNDRAVAIPTPAEPDRPLASHTESRAMKAGWAWRIPLTARTGNGYVYSSAFLGRDEAERELREQLGAAAADSPALHLSMRIGRVGRHWSKNCLAVGLSQGFIEPLEATALMLTQLTITRFLDQFDEGGSERFNDEINAMFDGVRNYVVGHFALNGRTDSDYWRANREGLTLPDTTLRLISVWDSEADFDRALKEEAPHHVYQRPSWYCLLAGMGRFPPRRGLPKPGLAVPGAKARAACRQLAELFPDQRNFFQNHMADFPASAVIGL
ncbi:MAG TPA: tryptophan halogenase family protein, partial [Magnetospirillaceae bacterium]|nr:tryptophan halogenase family protein [Magnetospirillaceae bacterium]